jgi:hypothetical protein
VLFWRQVVPDLFELVVRNRLMCLVVIDQKQVPVSKCVSVASRSCSRTYFAERVLFGSFFLTDTAVGVVDVVPVVVEPVGPRAARSLAVRVVGVADTGRSELDMRCE